jgi:PAS domain S-box-containing protein
MLPLFDQELFYEAWRAFIQRQVILPEVNPCVANSWMRCWARLNPQRPLQLRKLSPEHMLAAQVASFELISLARPIMEDIYQFVAGSDTAIVLTNNAGYVLDMVGDPDIIEVVESHSICPGASLSEMEMGTNAFALSILDRTPTRVAGAEHFFEVYHELAETAAPIFDLSGRLLGSLGVINLSFNHHPHSMGLVVAGAKAIEGQRQADLLLAEQNSQMAQLNAIIEASSDGLLVVDQHGVLMQINQAATKILGLARQAVVGRPLTEWVGYPGFLDEAVTQRDALTDVEIHIRIGERIVVCLVSLNYVIRDGAIHWVIILLRQPSVVRELVHQQVGAQAPLTLEDIPGDSAAIRKVQRFVRVAAPAQASILIRGESGTGKNVLASAIHNASPRRNGAFLIFGCTSIPHEWVISELLGYDEGLESRKAGGRPSKFELAEGGTMFFQNIDDLPLDAQSILLNVLDLGIMQRLGSERPIKVDVRIIASTSANIEKNIAQGNFRADLYYRLSAFEITLPPLRERLEDIPVLVERILNRVARQLSYELVLEPGVMELLMAYDWPGNVRELEAVLGRAAIQSGPSGSVPAYLLPASIQEGGAAQVIDAKTQVRTFYTLERESLLLAAQACKGNITEMAKLLGIGRTTVWRRLKEMDLDLREYRYGKGS